MTGPSAERSGRSGGEVGTEPGPAAAGPAPTGGPVAARPATAQPGPAHPDSGVPRLLQQTAAWSWRLLLTGLVIYLAFRLAVELRLVILPLIAALLLTALLEPLASRLRQRGLSPLLATWCMLLLALIVIGGAIALITNQIADQYQQLFTEVQHTANQLARSLAGPPFHINAARLHTLSQNLLNYISQHKSVVAGTVLTGGKYLTEFLAGIVLMLFISFFLLKDGARIWAWLISGMNPEGRRRMNNAGVQAWRALVNYVRGTVVVAAIHSVMLGLALWLLGVPLLVPLVVLVFLAAFVPILGILVAGGLAILVALATKGWVAAVILLAVLIVENQIEGHLLQPLVVGRIIRLHPLAIILVLAVGAIIAGIPGAIIAVPVAAVITYAWPALRAEEPDS
ncbi:MAG: AI-2E family transporter [Actinobacteria bacterium]|nr:AI-2E family transporter [Actinomycetota bacterium]